MSISVRHTILSSRPKPSPSSPLLECRCYGGNRSTSLTNSLGYPSSVVPPCNRCVSLPIGQLKPRSSCLEILSILAESTWHSISRMVGQPSPICKIELCFICLPLLSASLFSFAHQLLTSQSSPNATAKSPKQPPWNTKRPSALDSLTSSGFRGRTDSGQRASRAGQG